MPATVHRTSSSNPFPLFESCVGWNGCALRVSPWRELPTSRGKGCRCADLPSPCEAHRPTGWCQWASGVNASRRTRMRAPFVSRHRFLPPAFLSHSLNSVSGGTDARGGSRRGGNCLPVGEKAAGVPIFHPLVRHTGQPDGASGRPASTHHGEPERARRSSPDTTLFNHLNFYLNPLIRHIITPILRLIHDLVRHLHAADHLPKHRVFPVQESRVLHHDEKL